MKEVARFAAALALLVQEHAMAYKIDYDKMVLLDAEDLAETGMKEAYELLLPELEKYVVDPVSLEESIDNDTSRYSVLTAGAEYLIYAPKMDGGEGSSWGRATWAFFSIVNEQLKDTSVRFYAINGGNDLGGIFLTAEQFDDAKKSLKLKSDWPYMPTSEHPWYGQAH